MVNMELSGPRDIGGTDVRMQHLLENPRTSVSSIRFIDRTVLYLCESVREHERMCESMR